MHELEPDAVDALAAAAGTLLEEGATARALDSLVEAVAAATQAELVIARVAHSAAGDLLA